MENSGSNNNLQDDVLHSEHPSKLSAEDVAKAVQRHNREHKIGADKTTQPVKPAGKKH